LELEEELVSVFRSALKSAGFIGGPMVEQFEKQFAQFCEAEYCVGVGNGTDALRFALIAAGVQPGDTVVTVPNTFIATTEAISQAGARPDFVDIDERTYNMDARRLQEYFETQCCLDLRTGKLLNKKMRSPVTGIVPVHLYGQMTDMDPILELAERYKLFVIEDACQAHLGACGEAGAVTTNDSTLAGKVRMLRDHGQLQKYRHEIEGYNGRLDAIQAGILQVKLKHLPRWNEKRRTIARQYDELFRSHLDAIILPYESCRTKAVYHLYVIRVKNRDQLQMHLAHANIMAQVHYPTPLHLQTAYANLGHKKGDFPVTEGAVAEILSLPMYPQLDHHQQERIVQVVVNSIVGEGVDRRNPIVGSFVSEGRAD
jgi:dTDP-4-amino-4,6-dideoxygalactose transaminase